MLLPKSRKTLVEGYCFYAEETRPLLAEAGLSGMSEAMNRVP